MNNWAIANARMTEIIPTMNSKNIHRYLFPLAERFLRFVIRVLAIRRPYSGRARRVVFFSRAVIT